MSLDGALPPKEWVRCSLRQLWSARASWRSAWLAEMLRSRCWQTPGGTRLWVHGV